jgi:hypothetical protein
MAGVSAARRIALVKLGLAALIAAAALFAVFASTAGATTTPPVTGVWYPFAPYVDVSQWPPPNFTAFHSKAGVKDLTLAFVTAQGGTACEPTWGGYSAYPAYGTRAYQLSEINAFRHAGAGAVVPSFGGQSGTELANVCGTESALQAAYSKVISAYGVNHIDFDIEGSEVADFGAAKLRAAALAALQKVATKNKSVLRVALTLPVNPTGLTPDSKTVLLDTVSGGVSVSMVNGLAMDYGDSVAPKPSGKMGTYAIDAGNAIHTQLHAIFPSLTSPALESMIGLTPMIGINDTSDEIFTLANAKQLETSAAGQKLGMLSMWQINRDNQCATQTKTTQLSCSGVTQTPWEFSKLLNR